MKWHPLMIRLCLHLKYYSSTAYDILRDVVHLPSLRTLRDYSNCVKTKPGRHSTLMYFSFKLRTAVIISYIHHVGIQGGVLRQLLDQFVGVEEWQKHVCIIFDEIKIKEKLVYSTSGIRNHTYL